MCRGLTFLDDLVGVAVHVQGGQGDGRGVQTVVTSRVTPETSNHDGKIKLKGPL